MPKMTKPKLQDFGVTDGQYALYGGVNGHINGTFICFGLVCTVLATALVGGFVGSGWATLTFFASGFVFAYIGPVIATGIVGKFRRSRLLNSPVASRIRDYEVALANYTKAEREWEEAEQAKWVAEWASREAAKARLQKGTDYWRSLSGIELESEMAALCRRLGYDVETTPTSGDKGVDLVLWDFIRKKKIVVQCKSHKSPVGPAVVRELYGSMIAAKADKAVLACTGGFTRGVNEFVKGKPIELVSASGLALLADGLPEPNIDGQGPLEWD